VNRRTLKQWQARKRYAARRRIETALSLTDLVTYVGRRRRDEAFIRACLPYQRRWFELTSVDIRFRK
jgi:hypothetical protein